MNIAVVGTGYVGLTTGACLAEMGHHVIGVDIDPKKIELLNNGGCPIYEPGLPDLIKRHLKRHLHFTTDLAFALKNAEIIFLCVGTPPQPDGATDLSHVETAATSIAKTLDHYAVIVTKSTVPVGTAHWLKGVLKKHINVPFDVAANPEFLREGASVFDFLNPDRVVIGSETEQADRLLTDLYSPLNAPILHTDLNSAELIKHASNSFLALKISYANLVSQLCEKVGADITTVMDGVGIDKRIGRDYLHAGLGFGGFCFPKDLDAFIHVFQKNKIDSGLLESVREINTAQREHVIALAKDMLGKLSGKTICVLGLTFKPNTDDIRFSPAIFLIEDLLNNKAHVRTYDPQGMGHAKKQLPAVTYTDTPYAAAEGADLVIIATDWQEFKTLDLPKLHKLCPNVIDGRNIYDPSLMKELGFTYKSIGRQ